MTLCVASIFIRAWEGYNKWSECWDLPADCGVIGGGLCSGKVIYSTCRSAWSPYVSLHTVGAKIRVNFTRSLQAQLVLFLSLALSILSSSLSCSPPDVEEKSFVTVSFGWNVSLWHLPFERECVHAQVSKEQKVWGVHQSSPGLRIPFLLCELRLALKRPVLGFIYL